MTTLCKFISIESKPHTQMASEMCERIKEVIYSYADKLPFALVLGVLRVVEHELMEETK